MSGQKRTNGAEKEKRVTISRRAKQKEFLRIYEQLFGNVTNACRMAGVGRSTFYEWYNEDARFKRELDAVEPGEQLVDRAEHALVKKLEAGDTAAIIFTLKTKGRSRGWDEKQTGGSLEDAVKVYVNIDTDKI